MSNNIARPNLTNTLVLALTQCQDQVRLLEEQAQTITKLRNENETLKQELHNAQTISRAGNVDSGARAELQRLYQKDVDKQMEIDKLKAKLKIIKIKAQRRGLNDPLSSSPLPPSPIFPVISDGSKDTHAKAGTRPSDVSDTVGRGHLTKSRASSPRYLPANSATTKQLPDVPVPNLTEASLKQTSSSPHQKRPRCDGPKTAQPLEEISGNSRIDTRKPKEEDVPRKRQRRSDRGVGAITSLTEDGENHAFDVAGARPDPRMKGGHASAYERLNDLMSAPTPSRLPLIQIENPPPADTNNRHIGHREISTSESPDKSVLPSSEAQSRSRARSSLIGTNVNTGPEDEEPFRSRPLSRLDFSHFKLNPKTNDGLDYAYNEVVRGRHERKCLPGCTRPECCGNKFQALAATLPKTLQGMSDDDLLLDYLGKGSEARIKALTKAARENLLHEARTKLVANLYGKMHRDAHERGKSPPGFWTTDMPATQEQEKLRDQARTRERDEVKKRQQDALKGDGRWMFADE